jgi:hypothetical protein
VLDEEEKALRYSDPEACFQHAVRRGAFALDEVTAPLSPHIAAVVRSIATGERLPMPGPPLARTLHPHETRPDRPQPLEHDSELARTRQILASHPQLTRMLDEQIVEPSQALEAAHALDRLLGRYMTGTRYAAP